MSKISTGNTGEVKSCCDIVKVNSSDELASYLSDKLTAGAYVILTVKDGAVGSTIEITLDTSALSGQISSSDQLVKASSTDTNAASYLFNKLTHASPANGTILVKKNPAGTLVYFELDAGIDNLNDVTLSAMAAGQILRWDTASSKWVNDYAIEGTFSGTASKIPNSDSVADTLKALTITDAVDCGASGNSIMWKTKDVNIYGMPISKVAWSSTDVFTDHFPNAVPDPDCLSNQGIDPYGFRNKRYISIKSIESSPQGNGDGYAYAFANATIDEDWDAGDGSGIRARLFVASREVAPDAKQATVRVQYTIFDTDNNNVIDTVTKNVLWDLGDSIIKEVDFPLTLTRLTAGKPLNIFLAISIASDLYTPEAGYAMYDEVGITGLRIINLTKTINLRDADVDM